MNIDEVRRLLEAATPGPWSLQPATVFCDDKPSSFIDSCYTAISAVSWLQLAKVVTRFDDTNSNDAIGLANAALIAAAPDLAKLCIELSEGVTPMIQELSALRKELAACKKDAEQYAFLRRHLLIVYLGGKEPTIQNFARFDAATRTAMESRP